MIFKKYTTEVQKKDLKINLHRLGYFPDTKVDVHDVARIQSTHIFPYIFADFPCTPYFILISNFPNMDQLQIILPLVWTGKTYFTLYSAYWQTFLKIGIGKTSQCLIWYLISFHNLFIKSLSSFNPFQFPHNLSRMQ